MPLSFSGSVACSDCHPRSSQATQSCLPLAEQAENRRQECLVCRKFYPCTELEKSHILSQSMRSISSENCTQLTLRKGHIQKTPLSQLVKVKCILPGILVNVPGNASRSTGEKSPGLPASCHLGGLQRQALTWIRTPGTPFAEILVGPDVKATILHRLYMNSKG